MHLAIWLLVGILVGCLACTELVPALPRDRIVNVLAGAAGALSAAGLLSLSLGPDALALGEFGIANLVEAAFGAVLLLVLVNAVRLIRSP